MAPDRRVLGRPTPVVARMIRVLKDSLLRRLVSLLLSLMLALPNLGNVFTDAHVLSKLASAVVGSAALWIGISIFFVTGSYKATKDGPGSFPAK